MDYQNKMHYQEVMREYRSLPSTDMMSKKLYEDVTDVITKANRKQSCTNGEIMNTMKLIVMQLAEMCITFVEERDYEDLQEKYK